MKIRYFAETDTLYIEFRDAPVSETRELDADTMLDVDDGGRVCAMTIEHASVRTGVPQFTYEQIASASS